MCDSRHVDDDWEQLRCIRVNQWTEVSNLGILNGGSNWLEVPSTSQKWCERTIGYVEEFGWNLL